MNNLEKIGNLGKGSFADVYLVRNNQDNQIYAMKQIILSKIPKSEQESALNEVRILASIDHPNIIDFKEVFIDEKDKALNIIMEYATDKDLLSKIKYYKVMSKHISEETIWDYLIQIIFGLKVLHDKKIIHRDLKSANIFMSGNIIKIGDFNISKIVKSAFVISSQTGTPYYASPEIWAEKPYDYRTDIWSLGCIVYELCSYRPPFLGMTADELYKNILKGKFEPIPKTYSSDLSNIITKMLTVNPEKRPDCTKLLADPVIMQKIENLTNRTNFYANQQDVQMLKTIKFSYCLDELNKNLPKIKRYNTRSRSDKDLFTFKNNLVFEHQSKEDNSEPTKANPDTNQNNNKKQNQNAVSSDTNSSDSTGCSNNNEKSEKLKSPDSRDLSEVHTEHKKSGNISIPQSNIKIRTILSRKRIGENNPINIPITKSNSAIKSGKENQNPENNKKVTLESNIELANLRDKSDIKVNRKDPNPSKPAFSTRNVLNIFSNNDLIKKIECLKSHNKIIVNNKSSNVIDLSDSKNKIKINVLSNGNKDNTHHDNNIVKNKASGKNNAMSNVITINNNVTNNINIGETSKN